MGQISKALGLGATFAFRDKEYFLSPWNYGVLGKFELYLQEEALKTMKLMRPYLTDDEFKALAKETRRDIDTGLYTFGSDEVQKALNSRKHLQKLIVLCLQVKHPEVNDALVEEMMQEIGDTLMEKMNEANADPNAVKPKTIEN